MADIKFSEFPKATTSKDSDEIAILQDGVNKMIASPVLESKIINKTVSRVIEQGGASLNLINPIGVVPTYADLALITPTPELNDSYQVEADSLIYVYTETGFQADGEGFKVQPNVNGIVEKDNPNAVSGGEVFEKTLTKDVFLDIGLNLINPDDIKSNTSFSPATNKINTTTPDRFGYWLKVEQGQDYFVQGRDINLGGRSEVAFFVNISNTEEAISFIQEPPTPNTFYNLTFTPPLGANYAFINIAFTSDINPFLTTFMVSKGTTEKPFSVFEYGAIKLDKLSSSSVFNDTELPINGKSIGEYAVGKNKINKENIISNKYFSPGANTMMDNATGVWRGVWVDSFTVDENYIISGRGNRLEVAFFGSNRITPLSYVQNNEFKVPSNTEAIFINIDNTGVNTYNNTVMMRQSNESPTYEPYMSTWMLKKSITQYSNTPIIDDLDIKIAVPSVVASVIDDNLQLYKSGVFINSNKNTYDYKIVSSEGRNFPKYYELKPSVIGNLSSAVVVKNSDGIILLNKPFTIRKLAKLTSPSTQKNILCMGASAMANGYSTGELKRRLTTNTGNGTPMNPTGLNLSNIEFVGRKTGTQNPVNLEATGGWSWLDYTTEGRQAYRVQVSGIGSLSIGTRYKQGSLELELVEINTTGGNGELRLSYYNGTGTLTTNGVLNKVGGSGDGDNTINYTNSQLEMFNPFWNNGSLDFINYADLYCNGSIDVLIAHCGVNDIFSGVDMSVIISRIRTFADALFDDFPNCKFIVSSLPLPCPNGGMSWSYGASATSDYYTKTLQFYEFFNEIEKLQNETAYVNKLFHCPVVSQFDNENSYPTNLDLDPIVMFYENNRSSKEIVVGTNGVHPTENGAKLVADSFYRTLHLTGI